MPKLVYVLGDVHGEFGALNDFINRKIRQNKSLRAIAASWRAKGDDLEVIILQCGDFAFFWPGFNNDRCISNSVPFLKEGIVPIYWCAGNHEDHDTLDALFQANSSANNSNIAMVAPGVFFCRFGATLDLAPQLTVLFAGGAESMDKNERVPHKSWWPQEGISNEDLNRLKNVPRADIVVSHTAPAAFDLGRHFTSWWLAPQNHLYEPSRYYLDEVLEKYRPSQWFFGHFHHSMHGAYFGCDWQCLASLGDSGKCWEKLYIDN